MKYTIDVLLTNGEALNFKAIEADSEKAAIQQISETKDDFILFKQDGTYYKINEDHLIGYKVTSASDSDDEEPVKQVIN